MCKYIYCGDGNLDDGEECDDGNTVSGDGCTGCLIDKGFSCDNSNMPSVCSSKCGDKEVYKQYRDGKLIFEE